jgi:hypothetical protein
LWLAGRAVIFPAADMAWVNERFKAKYGLFKLLVDWRNSWRRPAMVVLEVTVSPELEGPVMGG